MTATAALPPPGKPSFSPGFLLTHDWDQLHTVLGLQDTTIREIDSAAEEDYQTVTFPISKSSQYHAIVSGKVLCDVQSVNGCPVQFVPDRVSHGVGDCRDEPLDAVVKMTYKVTHIVSASQDEPLSDDVINALRAIESKMFGKDLVPNDMDDFLDKFGSHFQTGVQKLGKCFSWMVVADEECNMKILKEIAAEIFTICDSHEAHFPASYEGVWYSPQGLLNSTAWSTEKKQVLKLVKLRVAQCGSVAERITSGEWKSRKEAHQLCKLDALSDSLMSVWTLIEKSWKEYQRYKKLANVIKDGWIRLVEKSQHNDVAIPHIPHHINIPGLVNPLKEFVKDLGMDLYLPAKLTLQKVRSLQISHDTMPTKKDLPWRVLEQMILMDAHCREYHIRNFAESVRQGSKKSLKKLDKAKAQKPKPGKEADTIPHPMDVMLLLFTCSDFMLRQVLARKLFMCRLAIPFIVPTAEGTVEMLVWPLRSIVMEWRNKENKAMEEALVKGKFNMVTFMRFGKGKFSKSKLMNEILSSSGHDVFFHQGAPCGNEKRLISNGTVEVSHFLPAGNQQDQFPEPALFFNLRGDACDHPVQHALLMDLATAVVIFVDIAELRESSVQQTLQETINKKRSQVIVVLTDSKGHEESEIETLQEEFSAVVGEALEVIEVVTTYEMESGQRNISSVNQEVREAVIKKMVTQPVVCVESYTASKVHTHCCDVDEIANQKCSTGKEVAEELLSEMKKLDICERKSVLLPQQGNCLYEIGRLLRKLHRGSGTHVSLADKEAIKQKIKAIRQRQSAASHDDRFTMKVVSLFHHNEDTKAFAIRWVQLELDDVSRTSLPMLQNDKNRLWKALTKARNEDAVTLVQSLKTKVRTAEQKVAAATCGLEHLMREVGQLYEVSLDLKKMDREDSMYHLSSLPDIVGKQLLEGYPVELMDGDHGFLPIAWVKAVFNSLAQLAGQKKKIFVLSVIGIQSSGKSTLLNTMFGLEFAVSAGRCTRGIYAQLLPVAHRADLPFDYMLVLDSEGLRAHELGEQNYEHDNELATLVIGLADLALINMKGENVMEMTDVLQIVVHAFLRMRLADSPHKRQCMFIHQNVSAVNATEKLAADRQKLQEHLNNMTKQASEAQGLAQTITSFNRIISFDCERDVVYFSDLWNGDPPMSNINQGYSTRAADTKQSILTEISQNFTSCITIPDFISRVEDMWNGVLADDFVFSFRSSLAAKAYIEMEREYARLSLLVEQSLLQWMNTYCKIQVERCISENDLHRCSGQLNVSLKAKIAELVTENMNILTAFFEKHRAGEIIIQWKSEKLSSFTMFGKALERQTQKDLENMKTRKMYQLRQNYASQTHEQEIIRKAIAVAESERGKFPTDAELTKQFDKMWDTWAADLATSSEDSRNVLDEFQLILYDKMNEEANLKEFQCQIERTPLVADESQSVINAEYVTKDHIILKERPITRKVKDGFFFLSKARFLYPAVEKANTMMKTVMQEVENICKRDIMFNRLHGREIIAMALAEIRAHNDLPFEKTEFAFTPLFRALLAIRIACSAAPKFDRMNQRFEDRHGVQAQMKAYRGRVFVLFKNKVKDASAEVTASEHFCETNKEKVKEYIRTELEQSVLNELYNAVGNTKYDLIIKMLDEITQTGNYTALHDYVLEPVKHATAWLQGFAEKHLFTSENGHTKYGDHAERLAGKIFAKVASSAAAATRSVSGMEDQYNTWITQFCQNMEDTVPLDSAQLKVHACCNIKSFDNFQKFLDADLQKLEKDIKADYQQVTAASVEWLDLTSPYLKALTRLWGCTELCPFCHEPCQDSDPNHKSSHRCVQHRPPGMRGTKDKDSKMLAVETCNFQVTTTNLSFNCGACDKQCQRTEHCTGTPGKSIFHPYREYKKYLPGWDIAPDPAGEASKYWQWAMCTFKTQLLEEYQGTKLEIPASWEGTTEQEARDSLRVF